MTPIALEPAKYYHIYNHANGKDNIFVTENNYSYFLEKYKYYLSDYIDTLSYCLMSNHFHFLIKIPDHGNLRPADFENLSVRISKQFSNFFNAYAKSLNKQEKRMGSLFNTPFKRKEITSEEQLRNTVLYIHANPVNHGFTKKVNEWQHSSYHSLISDKNTSLKRQEVIMLFDSVDNFIYCHNAVEHLSFKEFDEV